MLERFLTGLLADVERRSPTAIAAVVAGVSGAAVRRLLTETQWSATAVNDQRVAHMLSEATAGDGTLLIDDSSLRRQGRYSVGVSRQYCGEIGTKANCQVFVTTHYVDPYYAWPVNGRLYLPQDWAEDAARRSRAAIPAEVTFETKLELAWQLVDAARALNVPLGTVVSDSGYGDADTFLSGLETRRVAYGVGVRCDFRGRWPAEVAEAAQRPPAPRQAGPPRQRPYPEQLAERHRADAIIAAQPDTAWQSLTWRMGSAGPLTKQFVAVRVCRAVGDVTGPEGWLIGERPVPAATGQPTVNERRLYFSSLPLDTPLARLVELAHRRPGIERFYEDGKGFTGLDAYAARTWHGFHRHLILELLALSWLALHAPPPDTPVIVSTPLPDAPAERPLFPLRPGPLSECGADPPPGGRLSAGRTHRLVHSHWPSRCRPTPRPASLSGLGWPRQRPLT